MPQYSMKKTTFWTMVTCSVIFSLVFIFKAYNFIAPLTQPSELLAAKNVVAARPGPHHGIMTLLIAPSRFTRTSNDLKKAKAIGFPTKMISAKQINLKSVAVDNNAVSKYLNQNTLNPLQKMRFALFNKALQQFLASSSKLAIILFAGNSYQPKTFHKAVLALSHQQQLWDMVDLEAHKHMSKSLLAHQFVQHNWQLRWPLSARHGVFSGKGPVMINRYAAMQLLSRATPLKMDLNAFLHHDWEFNIKTAVLLPGLSGQGINSEKTYFKYKKWANKKTNFMYGWTHLKIYVMHLAHLKI